MNSRYSSRLHFSLVFLVLVMLLFFMAEGVLLGKGLVWAAYCPLFTGDFDPVANFSAPAWSDTEERAPCLSMRRAMWHELFRVDLLIMLMTVSFKVYKRQYF